MPRQRAREALKVRDDIDENRPRAVSKASPALAPRDLTTLSVGDITLYIAELQAEIGRVQADIAAKERRRGDAEALFRR